jgi:hypothetical protein
LTSLAGAGYQLNDGEDGSGFIISVLERAGGYYFDVGACQAIIDGKIGIKSGKGLSRFHETGIELEGGEKLDADVVLFATGFGSVLDTLGGFIEPKVLQKLKVRSPLFCTFEDVG